MGKVFGSENEVSTLGRDSTFIVSVSPRNNSSESFIYFYSSRTCDRILFGKELSEYKGSFHDLSNRDFFLASVVLVIPNTVVFYTKRASRDGVAASHNTCFFGSAHCAANLENLSSLLPTL